MWQGIVRRRIQIWLSFRGEESETWNIVHFTATVLNSAKLGKGHPCSANKVEVYANRWLHFAVWLHFLRWRCARNALLSTFFSMYRASSPWRRIGVLANRLGLFLSEMSQATAVLARAVIWRERTTSVCELLIFQGFLGFFLILSVIKTSWDLWFLIKKRPKVVKMPIKRLIILRD